MKTIRNTDNVSYIIDKEHFSFVLNIVEKDQRLGISVDYTIYQLEGDP